MNTVDPEPIFDRGAIVRTPTVGSFSRLGGVGLSRRLRVLSSHHPSGSLIRGHRSKSVTAFVIFGATAVFSSACVLGPSRSLQVSITEGQWSIEPEVISDAATLTFVFVNRGSDTHHPIVLSTSQSPERVAETLAERGTADLVIELVTPDLPSDFNLLPDIAEEGHFHPGENLDLPADALLHEADDGETVGFLFTDAVAPGTESSKSATAGKEGDTFGQRTTFVVLCMNLEHDARGEYAVFELVP